MEFCSDFCFINYVRDQNPVEDYSPEGDSNIKIMAKVFLFHQSVFITGSIGSYYLTLPKTLLIYLL